MNWEKIKEDLLEIIEGKEQSKLMKNRYYVHRAKRIIKKIDSNDFRKQK